MPLQLFLVSAEAASAISYSFPVSSSLSSSINRHLLLFYFNLMRPNNITADSVL